MTITIDREQRNALWTDAVTDLTGIGDICAALHEGNWSKARILRARYEQDMRLLDDIGWARHDPGEHFDLTIDPDELRRTIERLHADASSFAESRLLESGVEATLRSIRTHTTILSRLASGRAEPTGT